MSSMPRPSAGSRAVLRRPSPLSSMPRPSAASRAVLRRPSVLSVICFTLLANVDGFAAGCGRPLLRSPRAARTAHGLLRHRAPLCGLRVRVLSVGKAKTEPWIQTGIDEFCSRLRGVLDLELIAVRDDAALEGQLRRSSTEPCFLLDEGGAQASSVAFAERLYAGLEEGGSRLTFVIGGHNGLPASLKAEHRSRLLSLGLLTYPHQIAKLLLLEQLYRATEIRKGSKYHRE